MRALGIWLGGDFLKSFVFSRDFSKAVLILFILRFGLFRLFIQREIPEKVSVSVAFSASEGDVLIVKHLVPVIVLVSKEN
jgi:hypothetical protein